MNTLISEIKFIKRFFLLFIILYFFCNINPAEAQSFHTSIYSEDTTYSVSRTKELRINLQNFNFFRNNEYKGALVKGYTLPGMWLLPTVSYQPISSIKIELGAYMLKYWGQANYPSIHYGSLSTHNGENEQRGLHTLPFFRIRYVPVDGVSLILGNIYGQSNHGLIEPLYNKEMIMTSDPEAGVQLLWTNKAFDLDMWINWESFIFRGDNRQEEFTFGLSTRFKANTPLSPTYASSNKAHVYFPLQLLFKHQGGEINTTATSREVKTWLNAAAGIGLDIKIPYRYFNRLNFEADATYYGQQKGSVYPFDKGYGFLGKMVADFKDIRLNAGYWQCHNFVTLLGDPLFGAVSVSEEGLTYNNPKMAYMSLEYSHKISKGFALGVHADVYNTFSADITRKISNGEGSLSVATERMSNSISFLAGIYLRTDFSFLVKKFR